MSHRTDSSNFLETRQPQNNFMLENFDFKSLFGKIHRNQEIAPPVSAKPEQSSLNNIRELIVSGQLTQAKITVYNNIGFLNKKLESISSNDGVTSENYRQLKTLNNNYKQVGEWLQQLDLIPAKIQQLTASGQTAEITELNNKLAQIQKNINQHYGIENNIDQNQPH